MRRRLQRRSMAPRRPLLHRAQIPLAIVSAIVLVASAAYALYVVFS